MITEITSTSSSQLYPVSSIYEHDPYISLKPEITRSVDGYTYFKHPIYSKTRDVVFNRNTQFVLTSAMSILDILTDSQYSTTIAGVYTNIALGGGYLVASTDNKLYVSAVSVDDERAFFRVIPNNNNTVSILHGTGLYATVNNTLPFNITLESKLEEVDVERQQFIVNVFPNNKAHIIARFDNPVNFGPSTIQRFWSFSKTTSAIRAIGVVIDDDYTTKNDYIFTFSNYDIQYYSNGLTVDTTWVKYYNSIDSGDNGRDTTIQSSLTGVPVSKLISIPYKANIRDTTTEVNFAQLKTVLTPESNVYFKT